jgi:hypothetical protein
MGEAAVRALIDEIAGEPAPRAEYVFRPELVVRGSTGAVPVAALRQDPLREGPSPVAPHGAPAGPGRYGSQAV